jgi:hypothetical protein
VATIAVLPGRTLFSRPPFGAEFAEGGDVLLAAVCEPGGDPDRHLLAGVFEGGLARRGGQLGDSARALPVRRALPEPFAEQAIFPGVHGEPHTAPVGDLLRGLLQQEALIGVFEVNAPARAFPGDGLEILIGLVAEQREPEAAFAAEGPVARSGVTSGPAEQAHDVTLEIDGGDFLATVKRHVTPRRSRQ